MTQLENQLLDELEMQEKIVETLYQELEKREKEFTIQLSNLNQVTYQKLSELEMEFKKCLIN